MMDFLLIISPSVPVISALILKLVAMGLAVMAAGIEGGAKLGAVGKTIVWLSEKLNIKRNGGVYKDKAFDEYGRMIFQKYTVDFDMNKKVAEWQKQGLHVLVTRENATLGETYLDVIFQRTKTFSYRSFVGKHQIMIFRNFYDVLEFKGEGTQAHLYVEMVIAPDDMKKLAENPSLSIYDDEIYKNMSINVYIASTKRYVCSEIYKLVYYEYYQENRSSFRLSRIHNEHSDQIRTAIKRYKFQKKSVKSEMIKLSNDYSSMRPVSLNFCFAGPPGTSKTYAARAIAKELGRDIVEIDLSKIVYEEEFFEIFKKRDVLSFVFLLDEIDLMCPSRDLDDKLIKMKEEQRFEKLGMGMGSDGGNRDRSGCGIASDDGSLSDSESDGSLASTQNSNGTDLSTLISLVRETMERVRRMEKRLNMVYHILDVLQKMLANVLGAICYGIFMCFKFITNEPVPSGMYVSHTDNKGMVYITLQKYCNMFTFGVDPNGRRDTSIDSSVENEEKTPFTLRTLLNFISGGKTPEGLIIIATTNRPDKLDPALIRPGRLRLVEFKNLRRCDAVALLSENFVTEEEKAEIEKGLDRIGYQDYAASGALLEAIMSSSNSVEEVFVSLDRELRGEGTKADVNYVA